MNIDTSVGSTFFNSIIILFIAGIIFLKIIWISSEFRNYKQRVNINMIKTNFIELGILASQIFIAYYLPFPDTPFNSLITFAGVIMYITAFIIIIWAKVAMSRSWGIPGEHTRQQNKLVTNGPFAFSRNPLYIGWIMLYFGFALAIRSWLIILRIPLLIYFYKAAKAEEKLLEKTFGKEYIEYKNRVPRFLIAL